MAGLHGTAAAGFSRGARAYERGRPGYPPAMVGWLAGRLGLGPGSVVVDLAAGTGKLTRLLSPTGARVVAVEPVGAMRAELAEAVPGVEVIGGVAEAIPLGDALADAVTVAQAFHWFRHTPALAEIHRVLRDGAGLAVVFNRRDLTQPLHAALERVIAPHRRGAPRHEDDDWRAALATTALFEPLDEQHVPYEQVVDADGLVDRVLSTSSIASLDDEGRHRVAEQVRAVAAGHRPPLTLRYRTDVHVYRRR